VTATISSSSVTSGATSDDEPDATVASSPVVVRRNAGLAAVIGAAASAIAIAYLWRATASGAALDWALCLVVAGIAVLHLAHLVDARTPLLVADDLGVRIRFRHQWRGLPWDAVDTVAVTPRRGLRDGRLMFGPHSLARALDGLDARGRRAAALNQKLYGAAMAVPLGLTTRVSVHNDALLEALETLSAGRVDLVVLRSEQAGTDTEAEPLAEAEPDTEAEPEAGAEATDEAAHRSPLGRLGTAVSRIGRGRQHDVDAAPDDETAADEGETLDEETAEDEEPAPRRTAARSPLPFTSARRALRAQTEQPGSAATLGNAALLREQDGEERRSSLPEGDALRRHGGFELDPPRAEAGHAEDDVTVRPMASLGPAVAPLVIDEFVVEPAYDPVIGPELAAARHRTGLSVDQLAERTRIRPHVIESIEVDDFAPCGGDFYARGHLRTLARVLGRDPEQLVATFDQRYATAPINARKVFEAELATGMTGSMRRTSGGPNWSLLIGVVLALVMVWGVVRLFAGEPQEQLQPVPALNGSAGIAGDASAAPSAAASTATSSTGTSGAPMVPATTGKPVEVRLVAAHAPSHVVVRDGAGKVVWAGDLALDQARSLRAAPPVKVQAADAGAIDVAVAGHARGRVGVLGQPGHRTFPRAPGA
jgi:cytoskeletal protein RodZ